MGGHPKNSSGSMTRARREVGFNRSSSVPTPGPCDYVGDDRHEAHQKRFPAATIGRGPGHRLATSVTRLTASPGPGCYSVDVGSIARRRRGGVIGTGSGHQTPELSREGSPGPGAYSWDDRRQSHHWGGATGTFGRGPGHVSLSREGSPGPADYSTLPREFSSRARRTCVGTFGRAEGHGANFWEHDAVVQERRMFNIADRNKDGKLDFEEVCAILRRARPNMTTAEIELIFEQVDKNKDGKIVFSELADYIHEGGIGPSKRSAQKLKDAFLP